MSSPRVPVLALLGPLGLLALSCGGGSGGAAPATSGAVSGATPSPGATGAVYHVAPGGDDSGPGTAARPWRTIQKAADTLVAGETVYVESGTYAERVVPRNSGRADAPITFAAAPGAAAVVDGRSVTLPDDLAGLVHVQDRSFVRISGLRVVNAGPFDDNAGILVQHSDHVTVEKNTTDGTRSSGIGVWDSNNVVVDGNTVDHAGLSGWQECISVAITATFEVRNNVVRNCNKEGICLKDGSSHGRVSGNRVLDAVSTGIYVDAWDKHTEDIVLSGNVATGTGNGFAVASEQGGLLENVRLENNVAYGNDFVGIAVTTAGDSPTHPVRGLVIVNNTSAGNGRGDWGGGIAVDNPDAREVVVRNNVCSRNLYFQIAVAASGVTIDHNLVDGFRGTEDEVRGEASVEGDPLFANAGAADFHLRAGSPAVDKGSSALAPSSDFDGRARPVDGDRDGTAAWDIGAFELPTSG